MDKIAPTLKDKDRKLQDVVVMIDDVMHPDAYHLEDKYDEGTPPKPDTIPWLHDLCLDKRLKLWVFSTTLKEEGGLMVRADIIRKWLIGHGFPAKDITQVGFTQELTGNALYLGKNMYWVCNRNHLASPGALVHLTRSNHRAS